MKVIESTAQLSELAAGSVLTIGNFDGLHLGHKEILEAAKNAASMDQCSGVAVMIFDPHPWVILHPEKRPETLTPLPMKKKLLESLGVDFLLVLKDSMQLLDLSAEEFVEKFLVDNVKSKVIVEGDDFRFGHGRGGDVHLLQKLAADKGFEVVEVPAKQITLTTGEKVRVSSTLIRKLLAEGRVEDTAIALGRNYDLIGPVVSGRGHGKRLGFPTANLDIEEQMIPAEAVYAGLVRIAKSFDELFEPGEKLPAAFSIGSARTIAKEGPVLVEAHILTGDPGDLNGKYLAMEFVKKIRNQQKFGSEQELAAQIAKDCETTKDILATEKRQRYG